MVVRWTDGLSCGSWGDRRGHVRRRGVYEKLDSRFVVYITDLVMLHQIRYQDTRHVYSRGHVS